MSDFRCENCGAELVPRLPTSRVVECAQCSSTSMLIDDVFRLAGERGVFHRDDGLITLGDRLRVGSAILETVGHCQFDYGRGAWDEYWCIDHNNDGYWLSADEGDYAVEQRVVHPDGRFEPGAETVISGKRYKAVEVDRARCVAFRGELPEILELGDEHDYVVFAGDRKRMATLERWSDGHAWTVGHWYSAWDIKKL
ncbi:MAG: DUF4178 domain-containing protein [Pseudomonadota bacterium]